MFQNSGEWFGSRTMGKFMHDQIVDDDHRGLDDPPVEGQVFCLACRNPIDT